MKMNFEYFQVQKWMLQTARALRVDEKMGSFVQFPCSLLQLWSLICLKKWTFCNFVLASARTQKSFKAIYVYVPEKSRYTLSQNGIFYYAMTYFLGDIRVWGWRILLNFCWGSIFFDILFAIVSKTVAQTSINHIIFWKSVMRTFKSMYVTCFKRLKFLAEISTKLQKTYFFDNLRTVT